MHKKVILAGLLWAAHTVVWGQQTLRAIRQHLADSSIVLVAAHRSVHHQYPENSLPAFQAALDLGVDIIETDVKVTKDGIPVLMHDRTVNRTTNGTGDLEQKTYAELNQLVLKDPKGQLTAYKIPKLEELLRLTKGKILIDLDLKTDQLEPVLAVIRKTGTGEQVIFFDDEVASLKQVDQANSSYMLMPRAHSYATADSLLNLFHPEVVHIDASFYTPAVTQLIKKSRARVWINALGEPDKLLKEGQVDQAFANLLDNGANIIQTDEPERWLRVLRAKHKHP